MSDLNDQAVGALGGVSALATLTVWVVETPALIRYSVTAISVLAISLFIIANMIKRSRLVKKREEQLRELRD
ncbi:hypothetical protein [Curvivirga sp.]|uniref:hypothetical protein n=1 Tax=Curvivirga sp. TaxID=2856848 RepID=UPI003B58CA56